MNHTTDPRAAHLLRLAARCRQRALALLRRGDPRTARGYIAEANALLRRAKCA